MADLGKVIKAFEQCWEKEPNTRNCDDCPYEKHFDDGRGKSCVDRSHLDALELLKEYDAKAQGADSGMCEICSFYERAMPVKPHYNARTNWYECGACHYSMTSGMHCRTVLIPAYKVGFCAKCGKAVKWYE